MPGSNQKSGGESPMSVHSSIRSLRAQNDTERKVAVRSFLRSGYAVECGKGTGEERPSQFLSNYTLL